MIRAILFFVMLFGMAWQNASAVSDEYWSKNTQMLPQYCKDRAKGTQSSEWKKWRGTFGSVYQHMHHYCSGIYAEQKAKSAQSQRERVTQLGKVVHQMGYVSASCNAECVIYPELHVHWGWALAEKGQAAEAIQHYKLAIKAKPKYTLAYVRLSELYLAANQPEEARKSLETGLEARPNSRTLKRRLKELELSENEPELSENKPESSE